MNLHLPVNSLSVTCLLFSSAPPIKLSAIIWLKNVVESGVKHHHSNYTSKYTISAHQGKTSCDSLSETHSDSSTDKTDSNNITEKLSKVVLNANNFILPSVLRT